MPTTVWVATATIRLGTGSSRVVAYTAGNRVPDSVVAKYGLAGSGLVAQATIQSDGSSPNYSGVNPITRAELDAVLAALPASAAVTSVNGKTGVVTLTAANVGAQPAGSYVTPSSLAAVATTGAYADLTGKPTIPASYTDEQVRDVMGAALVAGSNVTITPNDAGDTITIAAATGSGSPADATATTKGVVQLAGDLAGTAAAPTVPGLAGKANTSHTHTATNISDSSTVGRSVLTAADAAAARTAIGAGTSNLALGTTSTTALAGNYAPTKATVGLGNVDNTADTAKPVSTAQQTALDAKVNADGITAIRTMTQAAYTALATKVATTLYVISG